MEILENISLKPYNTFGIEAMARKFSSFDSVETLKNMLKNHFPSETAIMVLGGGSNVLFTKNFEGLILLNQIKGISVLEEDENTVLVSCGAGEIWHDLVVYTIDKNWGGLENLSLIPGTVGASPMQNIGAYGAEIKDVFYSLKALEISTGDVKVFFHEDCKFGYRESVFKKELKGKYIILEVVFRLLKRPKINTSYGAILETLKEMGITSPSVKDVSEAVCKIRKSKLPDPKEIGNAGSFFKNPEITEEQFLKIALKFPNIPFFPSKPNWKKIPAGWLIEQCGWKGKMINNYGVHKNQALVLVNYGGAKGMDIYKLSEDIKKSVSDKFDILLETEVNII